MKTKVFLSYAGPNRDRIRDLKVAFPLLRNPLSYDVYDYNLDAVPSGKLVESLEQRIDQATIFVALISKEYTEKTRLTLTELEKAVSLQQESNKRKLLLLFVNDPAGAQWLSDPDKPEPLTLINRDHYAYVTLFNSDGDPEVLTGYGTQGGDVPLAVEIGEAGAARLQC